MSDYHRITRECSVNQLQPELRRAIQRYFQEQGLGSPDAETLLCCETVSTKRDFGRLASLLKGALETTVHTAMLLTSERLVWARNGDTSGIVLNAASLKDIQVRAYMSIFTRDTGLEIVGYIGDSKRQARGYLGMGVEPAAQKFCEEVEKAVAGAQPPPPPKKKLPKWLGG